MGHRRHQGKPPSRPNDDELVVFARWIARVYLEIERGQRCVAALQQLASKPLWARVRYLTPVPGQPAASQRDVGGVAVGGSSTRTTLIVVVVADGQGRWDALLIDVEQTASGRRHITGLRRLRDAASHCMQPPTPPQPVALPDTRARKAA